jgi:hypothetical protein
LKIFGVTVACARSGLASRTKALNSVMNVQILKIPHALDMKDCVKAAHEGEKTLEKRFCESKRVMLTIGLESKTRSGVALTVVVGFGGSRKLAFSVVSLLVSVRCL